MIRLRYDYDEKLTCSFFARVESRRSRIVVGSYSNRSRIAIVITALDNGARFNILTTTTTTTTTTIKFTAEQ